MLIDEVLYPEFFVKSFSSVAHDILNARAPANLAISGYGERLPGVWRRARGWALS
jgi:hypothetical protein